jgi:cell division protein FtsA
MAKAKIITALDIGSSTIKALAAVRKLESEDLEVLGQIQLPSLGIRRGVVINVDEVAKNIAEVLSQLQQDIGRKISDLYINLGGSHIFSTLSHGTVIVSRADRKISEEDVNRVIQAARAFPLTSNKEILEVFPKEFTVDGQGQIKEPLKMEVVRLEVDVLALCAFSPYLKNLTSAVLNAGFHIADIVPSCLASARAVLTPRQKELGVCLLDIGGGTTDLAVFEEGDLIHAAVFPIGSAHITNDIAVGLKVDIDIAEQIKREFGSCLMRGSNKKEKIKLSPDSENSELLTFSHKMLVGIIEARVSEIFGLVQEELKKISPRGSLPAGVVLTGGGAKLPKIVDLAKKELKLPARVEIPRGWQGLEKDPIWSTACGLVLGSQELEEKGKTHVWSFGPAKGIGAKFKKIFKIFIP